jgi:hypothetical protein
MSFIKSSSSKTHNRPSTEEVTRNIKLLDTALRKMLEAKKQWLREFDPDLRQALHFAYVTRQMEYNIQLGRSHDILHRGGTRRRHRRKHRKTRRHR